MASELTNVMSQDIFSVTKFIDKLKAKYIDISEDTLFLGVYGYLSAIFGNLIQNTAVQVSEYSKEAIPTRAKFERNIISHALALGLKKIAATPAELDILIGFPEDYLVQKQILSENDIEDPKSSRSSFEKMKKKMLEVEEQYHLNYLFKLDNNILKEDNILSIEFKSSINYVKSYPNR